ncbi:hypothetical protein CR513_44862, partial [Mucuna pruriens]
MVLVKKHYGKWRICVDYSNLNKACPKDSYPLPVTHRSTGRQGIRLSSSQLPRCMYLSDVNKTTFMTNGPTYYYQVMSFGLKNVGATYQKLMDKVFIDHINYNLKVYVDDMVVKSTSPKGHIKDLEEIFAQVRI